METKSIIIPWCDDINTGAEMCTFGGLRKYQDMYAARTHAIAIDLWYHIRGQFKGKRQSITTRCGSITFNI